MRDAIGQRRALDQLHDQERTAVALFETVNVRDPRMVERRQHLRFAAEPRQAFGIAGDRGQQHLDRDVAMQFRIACAIHFPHSAGADERSHRTRRAVAPRATTGWPLKTA